MLKAIVILFFSALVESEARPLALEENEVNHDPSVSSRTGFFQIKWDSQKNRDFQPSNDRKNRRHVTKGTASSSNLSTVN